MGQPHVKLVKVKPISGAQTVALIGKLVAPVTVLWLGGTVYLMAWVNEREFNHEVTSIYIVGQSYAAPGQSVANGTLAGGFVQAREDALDGASLHMPDGDWHYLTSEVMEHMATVYHVFASRPSEPPLGLRR